MTKLNQTESPMSIDLLLSISCSNPEDFQDFEDWEIQRRNNPEWDLHYRGWNRYNITLHCMDVTIIARLLEDNKTFEIREYLLQDH